VTRAAGEPGEEASSRLARDSMLVGAATVASRLLGFTRDVLIARLLGGGPVADAYLAALRLPNLVRRVLGEGGLNAPFVPLYLAIAREQGPGRARGFAAEALGSLAVLLSSSSWQARSSRPGWFSDLPAALPQSPQHWPTPPFSPG